MNRLPVSWTRQARCALDGYARTLALDSQAAARRFVVAVLAAAEGLSILPERGRRIPEDESETFRESYWKSYRIIYVVRADQVVVADVRHQRQELTECYLRAL
ncbi:MAG TPA: type II toxin-antitoxin system RelE/ParE family toxin [Longimicrobium sp.]|nr:type II toxin-antitoxin system RelE/ParE family toxin [Longimicrobium sp.]